MVEVKGPEADRLVRNLPANVGVYLICGVDAGLVSERVSSIIRASVSDTRDPFQVIILDGNDIATDPNTLLDEVYTIGLFGGRRAVRINHGTRAFHQTIELLLSTPPQDCIVVIEAGAIKPDAPLRKAIAASRNAIVIDCWNDDPRQVESLIDEETTTAGLSIDPAARTLLASLLGADRLATRSELAKLVLFSRDKGVITEDDVELSVSDASPSAFDDLVWHAFNGAEAAIEEALERHVSHQDLMAVPALIVRHCSLLHRLRSSVDNGQPVDAVIGQAYRVSYKRKASLKSQVQIWRSPSLLSILDYLRVSAGRSRRESHLADLIAIRSLWTVAAVAKRLRAAS